MRLLLIWITCLVVAGAEEKRVADIEYAKVGGESSRLDASVPEGEGPFPMAILIHGGGWGSGDKAQDFGTLERLLTDAGFTWFSINYRLAPQAKVPCELVEMKDAPHRIAEWGKIAPDYAEKVAGWLKGVLSER